MKIKINVKKIEKFQGFIYSAYLSEIANNIPADMLLDLSNVYTSAKFRKLLHDKCRRYIENMLCSSERIFIEAQIAKNNFEFEPRVDDGLMYGEVRIEEIINAKSRG